jgi:hypothetical protein
LITTLRHHYAIIIDDIDDAITPLPRHYAIIDYIDIYAIDITPLLPLLRHY